MDGAEILTRKKQLGGYTNQMGDVITLQLLSLPSLYHDICGPFVHLPGLIGVSAALVGCNSRLNYSGGELLCIHLNGPTLTSDIQ